MIKNKINSFNQDEPSHQILSELILKTIGGSNQSKSIKFEPEDAPIKIGRNQESQIQILSDEGISRC